MTLCLDGALDAGHYQPIIIYVSISFVYILVSIHLYITCFISFICLFVIDSLISSRPEVTMDVVMELISQMNSEQRSECIQLLKASPASIV